MHTISLLASMMVYSQEETSRGRLRGDDESGRLQTDSESVDVSSSEPKDTTHKGNPDTKLVC